MLMIFWYYNAIYIKLIIKTKSIQINTYYTDTVDMADPDLNSKTSDYQYIYIYICIYMVF